MDNDTNGTCPPLPPPNHTVLLLSTLVVVGAVGNTLVCLSIMIERKLQNATNYFLFSLAIADLMVCVFVMPATIVMEYHRGLWYHGYALCLAYTNLDVFLCSVSIVHMVVIALDRYRGINQPFKARNKTKSMVLAKVAIIWLVTAVICCPLLISVLRTPASLLANCRCGVFPNPKLRHFQLYGTLIIFGFPSIIMVVAFVKTSKLLRRQMVLATGDATGLRRHSRGKPVRKTRVEASNLNQIKSRLFRHTDYFIENQNPTASGIASTQAVNIALYQHIKGQKPKRKVGLYSLRPRMRQGMREAATTYLLIHRKDSPAMVLREKKATTVLAVVFLSFFACWSPFFVSNFVLAICQEACENTSKGFLGFVLWLGYFSSIINPVIYTTFNRRYRVTFYRLLCFQWRHNWKQTTRAALRTSVSHRAEANASLGAEDIEPDLGPSPGLLQSGSRSTGKSKSGGSRVQFQIDVEQHHLHDIQDEDVHREPLEPAAATEPRSWDDGRTEVNAKRNRKRKTLFDHAFSV